MGGNTGGNDCVHVLDIHAPMDGATVPDPAKVKLRPDTDVLIYDEHGNVCQFTYQEWDAFRLKMADGTFDHIGDYVAPVKTVPLGDHHFALTGMDPFDISRTGQPTGIDYDATGPRVPLDRGAEA